MVEQEEWEVEEVVICLQIYCEFYFIKGHMVPTCSYVVILIENIQYMFTV